MADDKKSRDKQAHDQERRQRERALKEEIERTGEPEPTVPEEVLADIAEEIDPLDYPVTGAEVIESVGDHVVESASEDHQVESLLPDTETEMFASPSDVRGRIQRPTVAEAMKRIVEAGVTLQHAEFGNSQLEAYERTLRELRRIDVEDRDEGVRAVSDWVVEEIRGEQRLPGSREIRRRAAKFCRSNGYSVRNDEWLGV